MLKKVRKKRCLGVEKMRGKIKENRWKIKEKEMEEANGWPPQVAGRRQ